MNRNTNANLNNLASWGAEIQENNYGNEAGDEVRYSRIQLVNPRGTMTLLFSMWVNGQWSPVTPVTNPERFMPTEVTTLKEWYAVIDRWNKASDESMKKEEAR
jgi:hypothetical protein